MNKVKVLIKTDDEELIPSYETPYAAGADLKANITADLEIKPGTSALVPSGIFLEIPKGFEVQIRPRSGLAYKNQITVLNTPGTIDSDYRGEIKVILINHSKTSFFIKPKMRIGQIILAPVYNAEFIIKKTLAGSARGEGGFGHTGTN